MCETDMIRNGALNNVSMVHNQTVKMMIIMCRPPDSSSMVHNQLYMNGNSRDYLTYRPPTVLVEKRLNFYVLMNQNSRHKQEVIAKPNIKE